jgi:hypothetical protein
LSGQAALRFAVMHVPGEPAINDTPGNRYQP